MSIKPSFLGCEYFPFKLKLSEKETDLLPFVGLDLMMYSTNYRYTITDFNSNSYQGIYNILTLVPTFSFGVNLSIEKYKLDFLLGFRSIYINVIREFSSHTYNTVEPFYKTDKNNKISISRPYVEYIFPPILTFDIRHKLNEHVAIQIGYNSFYRGH